MYVVTRAEAYNLDMYDKVMVLHGDTIALSRKGELHGIGKYDHAMSVFEDMLRALSDGEKLFRMP